MKNLFLHIVLFFSLVCFSQNDQLAQYYYDKGDFEKAKISFEELLTTEDTESTEEKQLRHAGFRYANGAA